MDITPSIPNSHQVIEAYGDGGFRITGQRYEGSVLVFAEQTQVWALQDWAAVTPEDITPLVATTPPPEMVVLGTGTRFEMLPKALKLWFRERRIPVEAMDTGAACRTYNILLSEGRRVTAAFIAV